MTAPAGPGPVVLGTVSAAAFLVLLSLGTWQMERLRWKEDLLATIAARTAAPVVPAPASAAALPEYRRIAARGMLRHDLEVLLVSRTRKGVAGAHVLTPLERRDGSSILVNRGFVPHDRFDRDTRREGLMTGEVQIEGILRLPPSSGPFVPDNDPASDTWYRIDPDEMGNHLGLPLLDYVLEADATPNPGGLPIGGQTRVDIRNAHLGYALTWYGLAGVLAFGMIAIGRSPRSP